jgi:hypothetical protein
METPPTVTVTADTGATTITGATRTAPNSADITYAHAAVVSLGTVDGYTFTYGQTITYADATDYPWMMCPEIEYDGDAIEYLFKSMSAVRGKFKVWVDDVMVSATPTAFGAAGWYRVKVDFGSVAKRRIRVEAQWVKFGGVYHKVELYTISPTTRYLGPPTGWVGDSYTANYPGVVADHWIYDGFPIQVGRAMGWHVYPLGVGGTGFAAGSGGGGETEYGGRNADLTAITGLEQIVIQGSINDRNISLGTVQAAIAAYLPAVNSAFPALKRKFTLGALAPQNSWAANTAAINSYLSSQSTTYGYTYVDMAGWVEGTGNVAATTGNGNADRYFVDDGAGAYGHLNQAGYDYVAKRIVGEHGQSERRLQTYLPLKVDKATLTAKGDLYAATASGQIARRSVGTDTYVLTADSAEATGMKWAAPSGGGGSTFTTGRWPDNGTITNPGSGVRSTMVWAAATWNDTGVTYNTTTGLFTVNTTGKYKIDVSLGMYQAKLLTLALYVNGVPHLERLEGYHVMDWVAAQLTSGWLELAATNTFQVRYEPDYTGTSSAIYTAPVNFVSVERYV